MNLVEYFMNGGVTFLKGNKFKFYILKSRVL